MPTTVLLLEPGLERDLYSTMSSNRMGSVEGVVEGEAETSGL
jgi:hypothetical protein